jgi:hypothetical protein
MTATQLQRMSQNNGAYDGVPFMESNDVNGGHIYESRQQHADYFTFDQHVPTTSHSYAHAQQSQVDMLYQQHHRRLPPTPDQVQQQFSGESI